MTAYMFLKILRVDKLINIGRVMKEIGWNDLDFEIETHEEAELVLDVLGLSEIIWSYSEKDINYIVENDINVITVYLDDLRFYKVPEEVYQ
jgi:hypothetical protein